jgi:DNA-binding ferritin-like protein
MGTETKKINVIDQYYDMINGRVKLASENKESTASKLLCTYLAMQRTMYLVFQHSHWKCKSPAFYANHLLFDRIYNKSKDLVDNTAEKIIGVFGNDSLNHEEQAKMIASLSEKYTTENHLTNSLEISKDFIRVADDIYSKLKESGDITLGIDDMIMSQCNSVEKFIYLLSQVSNNSGE